jgi:hypothetical protein
VVQPQPLDRRPAAVAETQELNWRLHQSKPPTRGDQQPGDQQRELPCRLEPLALYDHQTSPIPAQRAASHRRFTSLAQ